MSYDRYRTTSTTGPTTNHADSALSPGKKTLTEGLSPAPVQRKAAGRDLMPADDSDRAVDDARAMKLDDGDSDRGGKAAKSSAGGGGRVEVGATVVGAAADTEYAFDNSFTPALVKALHANPKLSIDDVLLQLSDNPLGTGKDNSNGLHHPTIVQYGLRMGAAGGTKAKAKGKGESPEKTAVLIANQNYVNISRLNTPIAEARTMKSELATRGYDAKVHTDQSAADMGTLWESMVGSAKQGDDLVAFFGGHGESNGLVGINHFLPPKQGDIFGNAQVSGVVSAATDKGANIRFVMDSCHSGSAVNAVREERQNELAKLADSTSDELRVSAATGLHGLKERLVAHCEGRAKTLRELNLEIKKHQAAAPDAADAAKTKKWADIGAKLEEARTKVEAKYDRKADKLWDEYAPMLEIVRSAVKRRAALPAIADYRTLGAQINYIDDLWNAVSQPAERNAAKAGAKPEASSTT